MVGLDTEWFPDLLPGLHSKTAVLQLGFSHKCFVFSLIHMQACPQVVADLLGDASILKTGQEVIYDVERMEDDYGVSVNGLVELKDIADRNNLPKSSLADLYQLVTGEDMKKPRKVTMSNWEKKPLTSQQISYAALDALVSRETLMGLHYIYGGHTNFMQWLLEQDFVMDQRRPDKEKSDRWNSERS